MGIDGKPLAAHSYENFKEEANRFFEVQLESLDLGRKQIEQQSIPELEDSSVRVDDALRAPESFGELRLKVTASAGAVLVASNSEAHVELGVVPLLLERKKAIIDRLRQLRGQRPIKTLSDLIGTVSDQDLRKQLLTELEAARQRATVGVSKPRIREGYAFVAMAMDSQDPQPEDVLDAIKEGAKKCGITAERIDEALSLTSRLLIAC